MKPIILLVEDDAVLRGGLKELFLREGYEVWEAASAREARQKQGENAALTVLDVGLPDGDGVSLCREWRSQGIRQPILFLTARDEEFDVVRALDSGGDDYVTKPFRMQELLSRIRVLLRPARQEGAAARGGYLTDTARMQILKDGAALPLTQTEYKIMALLLGSPGVIPRERLLEILWDDGGKFVDDNTLSVHMSRLRDKVGADAIKTVRGVGYQWCSTR